MNKINYSFIKLLTGSDLSKRRIPYMTIRNSVPGPLLWITACIHGDEIGGTVIIHEIFKKLKKSLCCGSVHAFPLVNPFGFEVSSRQIVFSREDLNRSFPGDEKGSVAQRIAARIFSVILETKPSFVIDLHNDWNKSIPYALLDPPQKNTSSENSLHAYAKNTGLLTIQDTDSIPASLSHNLLTQNIPALVLELGESYIINEKNIETGYNAILNILEFMKMIPEQEKHFLYPMPVNYINKILPYSSLPLSSTSGIIRFMVKPGDSIQKGQKVARIYNAFGKVSETVLSIYDGIVIGLTDTAIAFPGSPIMAMGIV